MSVPNIFGNRIYFVLYLRSIIKFKEKMLPRNGVFSVMTYTYVTDKL
jgi:hypothetical protein